MVSGDLRQPAADDRNVFGKKRKQLLQISTAFDGSVAVKAEYGEQQMCYAFTGTAHNAVAAGL